jgi:hypothetical protein
LPAREKYSTVYETCEALPSGGVVSFRFDEPVEARRLYEALRQWMLRKSYDGFQIAKRGHAVYVERVV